MDPEKGRFRMILVASLMVKPGAGEIFRDYERKAAAIMARRNERHG
jgi:hypothetical protein